MSKMNYYITVNSSLSKDCFVDNNATDFRNVISPIRLEGDWEITAIFIDTSVQTNNLIKVNLHEIDQQEYGTCNMDKCIYMFQGEKAGPFHCKRPTYYPINKNVLGSIHITLEDQDNRIINSQSSDVTTIKFHLRKQSIIMKVLHTSSLFDLALYPENNVLSYTNIISSIFHEYIDYSYWQIAVESVYIPFQLLKNTNVVSIQTNIIEEQRNGPALYSVIEDIPVKQSKDNNYFFYKKASLNFVPLQVTKLDSISISFLFDYVPANVDVKDVTKPVYVTFLLQKK